MEQTAEYKFELGFDEGTGIPKLNEEEMVRYIAEKTGLTKEQVEKVAIAEMEYMEECGLVLSGSPEEGILADVEV